MKPHKHAELIKAWADGFAIQISVNKGEEWEDTRPNFLVWSDEYEYRIKPEPKPDVVKYAQVKLNSFKHPRIDISSMYEWTTEPLANIVFTFDGETGELKSAEVLK